MILANTTANIAQISKDLLDQAVSFLLSTGPRLLGAILILIVGLLLVKLLEKLIYQALKKSKIDATAHKLIVQILSILLKIVVLLTAAGTLGIDTGSIITMLGAAGVAIGLALKDSLGNLAGGFLVLFSKPFVKGDFIETNSVAGTVDNITLFYTTLLTPDNKKIFIPNGEISTAKIVNYSAKATRRLDLAYSIRYQDDIATAKKILSDIVEQSPLALKDPEPAYVVAEYGENGIKLAVRIWVKTEDYWDLNFYMNEHVKSAFDQAGIAIPFHRLDVNLLSEQPK